MTQFSLIWLLLSACGNGFDKEGENISESDTDTDTDTDTDADTDTDTDTGPSPLDTDDDGDGYTENGGDCDDTNAQINPEGSDTTVDNMDQNCDGLDGPDEDRDGYVDAALGGDDCDDDNPYVNPGATENPQDGLDTDCDGVGDSRFQVGYVDEDCIDCTGPSAIAVDSAGQVHVVYEDNQQLWYRYLQNEFGNWSSYETITTNNSRSVAFVSETLYGLDAKVDTADNVQVAYISTGSTDTSLYYMFRNYLGEWSDESIIDGYQPSEGLNETDVGYFVEMAIDSSNKPVVAYYNAERGLPYLFDFTDQIIDFVTDLGGIYLPLDVWTGFEIGNRYSGTYISLAQDSSNTTHVAYFNNNPTPLIGSIESQYNRIPDLSSQNTVGLVQDPISFLTSGNACWPGQSVADQGIYNSLAINGNQVCIAYKGYNDGNLYYGCKSTTSGCEGWAFETVDSTGNVGDYATLEFTSEGQPYIAYQNASLGQLKVATKENSSWEIIDVDQSSGVNVGKYADMTIDNNDVVHISYKEVVGGKGYIKYAWGR